jgi:hypothetical protein
MVVFYLPIAALALVRNFTAVLTSVLESDVLRQGIENSLISGWRGRRRLASFPKVQYFKLLTH